MIAILLTCTFLSLVLVTGAIFASKECCLPLAVLIAIMLVFLNAYTSYETYKTGYLDARYDRVAIDTLSLDKNGSIQNFRPVFK